MPIITLNDSNLEDKIAINPKNAEVTIATVGTWTGTLEVGYIIDDTVEVYDDGAFTENFDRVFHPATDFTNFKLDGSGEIKIQYTVSKFAK